MGLHRVLADGQSFGNFPVTQPLGDELKDLELARSHAEAFHTLGIHRKGAGDSNLLHDHRLPRPHKAQPEPDSKGREDQGDESPVDLERVLDYEKPVLHHPQQGDEDSAQEPVNEDSALHFLYNTAAGLPSRYRRSSM